jgi:hypothetical protein
MTEMVAAVPTRTGTLNVLAIPSAIVSWNGRRLGETPIANFEMPAGRHRLLLRPTSGGPAKTITVTIRPGERTRRSVSLAAID